MQPVLSLVAAAILVLATLAPGGAGAETTREGIRAGPELAQGLTDKGRTAQPPPQGGGDGGWLGLTGRLLEYFSHGHPAPPAAHSGGRVGGGQLPVRHAVLLRRRPVLLQARVQPAALPLSADAP